MELVTLSEVATRTGLTRPEVADFKHFNGVRPQTVRDGPGDWRYDPSDFAPLLGAAG